jgi:hypothetical protein
MKKKLLRVTLLCLFLNSISIYSQQAFNSIGASYSSNAGSLTYSVGEIILDFKPSTAGSVSEGIIQPQEIFSALNTDYNAISLQYKVYPNPTSDFLQLTLDNTLDNLRYELIDISGRIISKKTIRSKKTIINLKNISVGFYFLKLTRNNQLIKNFKLIKQK